MFCFNCRAFYFSNNHFISSKIFPVLVRCSFYIEQVHSKSRDCIFWNWPIIPRYVNVTGQVLPSLICQYKELFYKDSMNSVKMQNLSLDSPSFTALLFARFIGCIISDKFMVTYRTNDVNTSYINLITSCISGSNGNSTAKPQFENQMLLHKECTLYLNSESLTLVDTTFALGYVGHVFHNEKPT